MIQEDGEEIYRKWSTTRYILFLVAIPLGVVAVITRHHSYAVFWSLGTVLAAGLGIMTSIILHLDGVPLFNRRSDGTAR